MTYADIVAMLEETGLPLAYDHFEEGDSPEPPFLVFLFPDTGFFFADGRVYKKINELHIELYTDKKQPDVEERVEGVLDSRGICYGKSEVWIPEEELYEVRYSTEVIYEQEQDQVQS